MKFTIDRKRWLRGEGSDKSFLLRPSDGKMCCLGFYALACGVSEWTITGASLPRWAHTYPEHAQWLFGSRRSALCESPCETLAAINDDMFSITTEAIREEKIVAVFAQYGVEVEFVD